MTKLMTLSSIAVLLGAAVTLKPEAANPALSGTLTLSQVNWITDETVAIVDVPLPDAELRRVANGAYPWRHEDGDLVFVQGCGSRANRLVIGDARGGARVVSPCSSELENGTARSTRFEFSRLSPDKRRIAAEVRYVADVGDGMKYYYATVVVEDSTIIATWDGYAAPEWLPDGRLLLAAEGMYVTEISGSPQRLDDGSLTVGVNNMDLSPDGELIAFEWNQRLWVMGVDGGEYKEMMTGPHQYRFPAWSPDGNYIAFLAVTGESYSEILSSVFFLNIRNGEVQTTDLSRFGGNLNHKPFGPLSWRR